MVDCARQRIVQVKRQPLTILVTLEPDDKALERVRAACPDCCIRVGPRIESPAERLPAKLMRGTDILLCEFPPVNFDGFDQLQWIQLSSAGYTQRRDLPILQRGIRVTNGLGNFDVPIAEWNVMMMLMWEREIRVQLENQKRKIWDRAAQFQSDVFGRTIGFFGYGGIARATARVAQALHLKVWAMTRDGTTKPRDRIYCVPGTGDPAGELPDRVFSPDDIEEFMGDVDYLFVTMPLTNATEGILGERELRMLKPSAVLINPARAGIVNEQALLRCLREKWIRGASFDVHYEYPLPAEHPLWEMPNIILTCHVSGSCSSPHFLERIYDIFSRNCRAFVNGESMLNELSESQLRGH